MQNEEGNGEIPVLPIALIDGDVVLPAMLAYATPGNIQPPGSRFICEFLSDGLRLTEPPIFHRGWGAWFLSIILLLSGIVVLVANRTQVGAGLLVGITFLSLAAIFVGEGWRQGTRPLIVEVRRSELFVIRPALGRKTNEMAVRIDQRNSRAELICERHFEASVEDSPDKTIWIANSDFRQQAER
jgi:hypothetical protein